uniref:PA domain-containing protein n=1 Tax=Pseudictyota dubia TaxID=2749911 RepID=A0A7R9WI38_9STRA|mmetsp:Transcript_50570/g.93493  ORF Transcript_50570/g.93493 Transcript_50570/m.93493 type:complete len:516 (+) Transcript_50570:95-1642(+)|eukprot:CAMPEP_0197446850 /NCGR_PEP_ID=MMETSP1175-20131217/11681_1 /TAXON_ID=1003142 /ORGANISM="Triceratium dubium, Strain CCMP147" /LENGTH=515 /DNA_ID=CAMNT_0042978015 /DNA_START=80 /DNA_END=1627 /DNA_ORIENTATION=+
MTAFRRLALAAVANLASKSICADAANGVSSKLQVHIPKTLTKAGGYDHREALFGVPPYGGSLQQNVYYADADLCDANVDTRAGFPIRAKDEDGNMLPWPSPYILMVDRGGCTFVQKVRNAQRSGAAGVIIADNTCLCSAGDACFSDPGVDCETREPIMADDGSGSDISIPSFLMFKQDADPVKAELRANRMVRLEMAWSLPSPDDRVEYEFWSTPTDLVAKDFQKQWKAAAAALGARAYFTPHMYIYDGIKSGCQGADGENQCYNLCTNNGRYCATDPDNDLDQGISGADVVAESLRRTCIWKHYGEKDGVGGSWWDYVNEFMFRCDTEDYFTNPDCIKDAMAHSGIDAGRIDQCMGDSGGLEDDVPNTILEDQLAAKDSTGVVILPAAYVNGAAIRGALEFDVIFKAICAGYLAGTEPQICTECSNCPDEHKCVINGYCHTPAAEGAVSNQVFAVSMLGLAAFFGCVGFIQWRRSQRQTREQVRSILAEYMPLDEENKVSTAITDDDEAEGEFS